MKRTLAACALVAATGLAAAQTPAQTEPPAKPPARPANDRPALNLKLDNPASFARNTESEKDSAKALPSLGGDARPVPQPSSDSRSSPFPKGQ